MEMELVKVETIVKIQIPHTNPSEGIPQTNPLRGVIPLPPSVASHLPPSPISSSKHPSPPISFEAPHHDFSPSTTALFRLSEGHSYKNRLQEFAQRSSIALPVYQTVNMGVVHAPRFRAMVLVNGMSYTSQNTFSQRKSAEQDVARVALECQSVQLKNDGCLLVYENTSFSKTILNEYAAKVNIERPIYQTVQIEGLLPLFVSSLVFNGAKYTGNTARNKKDAEQLAARVAILSILGGSGSSRLYEIIKSKSRIYDAVNPNKFHHVDAEVG